MAVRRATRHKGLVITLTLIVGLSSCSEDAADRDSSTTTVDDSTNSSSSTADTATTALPAPLAPFDDVTADLTVAEVDGALQFTFVVTNEGEFDLAIVPLGQPANGSVDGDTWVVSSILPRDSPVDDALLVPARGGTLYYDEQPFGPIDRSATQVKLCMEGGVLTSSTEPSATSDLAYTILHAAAPNVGVVCSSAVDLPRR